MKEVVKKKSEGNSGKTNHQPFFQGIDKAKLVRESFFAPSTSFALNDGTKIQAKLEVGAANSPAEKEADAIADQVMHMPEPQTIQRKCVARKEKEKISSKHLAETISKKSSGDSVPLSNSLNNQIQNNRGGGRSMDPSTQTFMNSRFGSDFSEVNIHTDSSSIQMNQELNARAFTVGKDVFFNKGEYNPGTDDGKRLLAHELTHVVQEGDKKNIPIRRAVKNYSDLKNKLSYGLLDWVITDGEVREVLDYLRKLDDDNFTVIVRKMVNDGLEQRLFNNLSDSDKKKYSDVVGRINSQIKRYAAFTEESKRALRNIKDIIELTKIGQYLIAGNILLTALDFGPESAYSISDTDWALVQQAIQSFPVIARNRIETIIQLQILRLMNSGDDLADEKEFWNQMGRVSGIL